MERTQWHVNNAQNSFFSFAENVRRDGYAVVFTNGCFDLLHPGHIALLKAAKESTPNAILCVGLNSDDSIRRLKGEGRPVLSEYERAQMLLSTRFVDHVWSFNTESELETMIQSIRPDVLVKGGDWTIDTVLGRQYAKQVHLVDLVDNISTTEIVNRILNGTATS